MNSNLIRCHLEFFNPWNLLLRNVERINAFIFLLEKLRNLGNKEWIRPSSILWPCQLLISWLSSRLIPGSFFLKWSATLSLIQPPLLPSQVNLKCPPLEFCSHKFLFCSRPFLAILNGFILWRGTILCIMYWMLPSYLAEGHCLLRQSWHWEWKRMGKGCVFEFTSCYLCPWAHGLQHV